MAAGAAGGGLGPRLAALLPWVFVAGFFAFILAFLVGPTLALAVQAFAGPHGFTLHYVRELGSFNNRLAFENSLIVAVASALVGLVAGGLIANAMLQPGAPDWLRSLVSSFAAVAANFAGVPLAFAFIATYGTLGVFTLFLKALGVDLYGLGFSLYSLTGLTLTYAYFQIPLMVIIFIPALEGLRQEWREAAANLGATRLGFWRHVGLPVLAPSLLAAFVLLFGSGFSAYATAYALTAGNIALVTITISNVLSGNVMLAPQVGAALSVGMIAVMVVLILLYALASRRAARWRR